MDVSQIQGGVMLNSRIGPGLFVFALTIFGLPAGAAAVVVTTAADPVPPGACATTGTGSCSLREAIMFTNSNGGGTISFTIPGGGVHTISPVSPLPAIAAATMVDGYSQPGAAVNTATIQNGTNAVLLIELDNTHNGGGGLVVTGNLAIVQGLVSNRSIGPGMTISGNGVQVRGNFIGTNPAGTASGPGNLDGIAVGGIGDVIGGNTADTRNLVSGNAAAGVRVSGDGSLNGVVSNNLIGTNAAGTAAVPNLAQGVVISGQGHLVGLGPTSQGNVISGNVSSGVLVATALVSATIAGNNIGANAAGTAPLGNGSDGITANSSNVLIGGDTAPEGNVIGGSGGNGILINGSSNQIFYNSIGLLPNGGANPNANAGISVHPFSNGNKIGGSLVPPYAFAPNIITNSGGNGVEIQGAGVTGGTGNYIWGNSIFGNGGLGIKLGSGSSPTPNDPGDADTGPNHLQNYPVITSVSSAAGGSVTFTLNSVANHDFLISIYSSAGCDPSGYGEGQTHLGDGGEVTDGSGNLSDTFVNINSILPPGQFAITMTAIDYGDASTSEFSNCVLMSPPALVSAVSRKSHGGAGTFNLPLSIVASGVNHNPTVEPRQSSTSTIVMTFDQSVVSADVAVIEGTATVGAVTFSGPDVIVPLTGVLDQQYVTVSATNVQSAFTSGGSGSVRIGFLLGDVSQNRVVSLADLGLVNAQLSQPVTAANFLKDVNGSGSITLADKGLTNANLTRALPPP
jgi:CSLREA domain-containing protein